MLLNNLKTPSSIQDFLDTLAINWEPQGDTCMSPRLVLRERKAHCIEGALLAALALRLHGHPPLIMDLKTTAPDYDHVVALYRTRGKWGAISKTNHAALRFREPIFETIRELALSYFHEYFTDNGKKTLRSYSDSLNLSRFDKRNWMTDEHDVFYIAVHLDRILHHPLLTASGIRNLRRADPIEIAAGKLLEWNKRDVQLFKKKKKR